MNIEIIGRNEFTSNEENAEAKYLKFKNRQLEDENKLLLAMLKVAIGRRTLRITEEILDEEPHFEVDNNLGGDILIRCI